ncbi:RNA-directed DNA polymerase protein [Dioscorea alata]|uniref:RNA-directed DNA polymerase protein n=1 Tax=Dioscorea alata TaxID=55571 RepID=A0ACB7VE87_DIOAL|nr:RNA-directed DNA polymerase protein [Dioscorea alata]
MEAAMVTYTQKEGKGVNAFVTGHGVHNKPKFGNQKGGPNAEMSKSEQLRNNKDSLFYTYCKKPRHTKEQCWKLHGKPPSREWGQRGTPQKGHGHTNMAESNGPEDTSSSNDTLERIRSLLNSLEKPSGSSNLIYSGMSLSLFSLNASNIRNTPPWIVDSGATDHMTFLASSFLTYTPCPSTQKIVVADSSLITVAGVGDIQLTSSILLKNVLHVPKISVNLISIQKLTQDMPCTAILTVVTVYFRPRTRGKRLDVLSKGATFISLKYVVVTSGVSTVCSV